MSSELHRFGFHDQQDDARWRENVEKLLRALVTNPHLLVGDGESKVIFPAPPINRRGTAGGGGLASMLDPWQPIYTQEGTEPSITYKCRFNLGTINNVPATNWNDEFTLGMAADTYHFVVVTVTSASGQVTGLTLSVDTTAPATDDIAKGTPPTSHKIVLGAIGRTQAKMIETTNLNAVASVVFLESKDAPAVGAEPYDRWWRWNHSTI